MKLLTFEYNVLAWHMLRGGGWQGGTVIRADARGGGWQGGTVVRADGSWAARWIGALGFKWVHGPLRICFMSVERFILTFIFHSHLSSFLFFLLNKSKFTPIKSSFTTFKSDRTRKKFSSTTHSFSLRTTDTFFPNKARWPLSHKNERTRLHHNWSSKNYEN